MEKINPLYVIVHCSKTNPSLQFLIDNDNHFHYQYVRVKIWSGCMMKRMHIVVMLLLFVLVLTACSNNSKKQSEDKEVAEKDPETTVKTDEKEEAVIHTVTDWTGHSVEIPINPERVIFHGETTGDLVVLGVEPVGILYNSIEHSLTEEHFKDIEDVGFPFNVEKAISLNPDLIIFGNSDEAQYEHIEKVAPTVTFDTFASLEERMSILGQLLGKEAEAENWLAEYKSKEEAMWKKVHESGIGEGETATVLTMYPGNRLFVMAKTGLSQILYNPGGLKPTELTQKALDEDIGFVEISFETLSDYVGDHVFLLTPIDAEAQVEQEEMQKGAIWRNLPAVQNGNVYTFGINEAYSDALSREWLIEQLPERLLKK